MKNPLTKLGEIVDFAVFGKKPETDEDRLKEIQRLKDAAKENPEDGN